MRPTSPLARLLRRALTVLCVAAVLLPATALAAPDPGARQTEIREELERARQGIEDVERRRVVTVEDLRVVDAERARLDAELAALGEDLRGAQTALDGAEARVAARTAELAATEQSLHETQAELAGKRADFAARARAAYMQGGIAPIITVLEARDVAELSRRLAYVEGVLRHDRDQVTGVAGLARQIIAETRRLEALRQQEEAARAVARDERDRVAGIVAQQEHVRAQIAAEQERHRLILVQLEADKHSYEHLVASLQEEGRRLEEELRRRAEEQRRRTEQDRRRAAAGSGRAAAVAAPAGSGQLQRPAAGAVTSGYGWRTHPIFRSRRFHAGVDFSGGFGAPIFAAEAGVVVSAGARGGYGNAVVVDHGGGLATLYAHQQRIHVSAGQRVERGEQLGEIGSTGYSTGPHLHFEVRVNGETRDPMAYL